MVSALGQNDCYNHYISAFLEWLLCVTAELIKMVQYLSSDLFSGFLNNILFVWPLFGLFLESILPETPYPEQSTEVYGLWESQL